MHTALPIMDTDLTLEDENCRTSFEFRFWFLGEHPPETWVPEAKAGGTAVAKSRMPRSGRRRELQPGSQQARSVEETRQLASDASQTFVLLDISDLKSAGSLGETVRNKAASLSKASGMLSLSLSVCLGQLRSPVIYALVFMVLFRV